MSVLVAVLGAVLCFIVATACLNTLYLPRLGKRRRARWEPVVSVLIPARDEAETIGAALNGLLAQSYGRLEIWVLDDHSQDETAAIVAALAEGDPRLRMLAGRPLPAGWLGKNWACQQLAQVAGGEILLFADADVGWQPDAVAQIVAEMHATGADLLSVWPTQHAGTLAERLIVPLMSLVLLGYLPWPLVHHTPWSVFAAANGQCLAFRRAAYAAVGEHKAVRDDVLEDVALARRIKRAGLRLRLVDAQGQLNCRMYQGWRQVRQGFGKNILVGYGDSVTLLLLATAFHWLVFVWPWLWLLAGFWVPGSGWPLLPALLVSLGVGARLLTAVATGQSARDAWLMPLSVILMTGVAGQALWWRWSGGPVWKGRRAVVDQAREGT